MLWYPLTFTLGLALSVTSWTTESEAASNHARHHLNPVVPQSHLTDLDVVCSKEYMTVNMKFDHPFEGLVFSHAAQPHQRCVHVGPHAGVREATFRIRYDGCGTTEDTRGHFHENTIVVQFETDILEAWDEAKKLRCEWLTDFEKSSSEPLVSIAELDVVELNFQGDDIECWMEIQEGKGPWARQLEGLVLLGSPLTLVIAINDHNKEFDMKVKECYASDGGGFTVPLTDENGCVLRSTLLTPFLKVRDFSSRATLLAYSYLYAFKFPDNLDVYIRCTVEVCRHGCFDSCPHQPTSGLKPSPRDPENILGAGLKLEEIRKEFHHQKFLEHHEVQEHAVEVPPQYDKFNPRPGRTRETEESNINSVNALFHESSVKATRYNASHYITSEEAQEVNLSPFSGTHSALQEEVHSEDGAKVQIGGTYTAHHGQKSFGITEQKISHSDTPFHFNAEPLPEPQSHVSLETHNKQIHWDTSKQEHHPHDHPRVFHSHKSPVGQQYNIPQPEPEPEPSSAHSFQHEQTKNGYKGDATLYHSKPIPSRHSHNHPRGFPSFESHTAGHWNAPQPEPEPSFQHFKNEQDESKQEDEDHIILFHPNPLPEPPTLFDTVHSSEKHVLRYTPPPPSTDPAPVYNPKQQMSSMNTSKQMMMMMGMSSMKAMYPPSYMNSMSMLSKYRQHHYPYPIPQFSPNQAMMMLNVVADRRADENAEDLQAADRPPVSGFAHPVQARTFEIGEDTSKQKNLQVADRVPISEFVQTRTSEKDEGTSKRKVIPGPRILRVKRSESVFGVQQKFRVISPADLAFELNATADSMAILQGRREDIVYGVCMTTTGLGASVGILLFLTACSMIFATLLFHKHQQLKMKTPNTVSPFNGIFNGYIEHVYKPRASRRTTKGLKIIEIS